MWGRKAQKKDDYQMARNGDHFLVPFECDVCIFRKLKKYSPETQDPQDALLMACIRQVNLDAFWSRASDTVAGNRDKLRLGMRMSELVGLDGPYVQDGPLPSFDHCGYEVAVQMLLYSRRSGAKGRKNIQFDSVRKLRSCYSNQVRASSQSNRTTVSMGDTKGHYQRLSSDPCASFWFYRFIEGARIRMGQEWRPNQAMSINLLLATLESIEDRIDNAPSARELNRWIVFHAFVVVTYVLSLRGPEGFLLDLGELRRHWKSTENTHVLVALRGKIKGEHHHRVHMIPCVPVTSSGIEVSVTLQRLLDHKLSGGFVDGPAISDVEGTLYKTRAIDDCLHEILEDLFDSRRELFPPNIASVENLRERYQVFRTLRRTSDTRATDETVSPKDIDIVNRWEAVGHGPGKKPTGPMRIYYADISLLLQPFLRYSWAM
jgi:hypothetical protein